MKSGLEKTAESIDTPFDAACAVVGGAGGAVAAAYGMAAVAPAALANPHIATSVGAAAIGGGALVGAKVGKAIREGLSD